METTGAICHREYPLSFKAFSLALTAENCSGGSLTAGAAAAVAVFAAASSRPLRLGFLTASAYLGCAGFADDSDTVGAVAATAAGRGLRTCDRVVSPASLSLDTRLLALFL